MKNELEHIKKEYNLENIKAYSSYDGKLITKIINNSIQFDGPDIVSIVDGTVYGIEHFEYDCYKNKKGSKYREEEFLIRDDLRKKAMNQPNVMVSNVSQVEIEGSIHLYLDNFNRELKEHYEKVDDYISRLKNNYQNYNDYKILFFAEDKDPIGTATQTNNGIHIILPFMFEKSLVQIESCSKLSGIIYTFFDAVGNGIFIATSKDYQEIRKKYMFDEDKIELITSTPQSSTHAIYISIK